MITIEKYKNKLKHTEVAEINHATCTITPLGWWSVTTSKHINYVGSEYGYEVQKVD